jgi:hypothetical protein
MTIPPSRLMVAETELTVLSVHYVPFLHAPPSDEAEYDAATRATTVWRRDCFVKEGNQCK